MRMEYLKRQNPWIIAFALALIVVGGYRALFAAPADFPAGSIVVIARGTSAPQIGEQLAEKRIVANASVLRSVLRALGKSGSVQSGAYRFESAQNVFTVANRLATGAYGFPPIRITLAEGTTVREMAEKVASALPEVSASDFLQEARPYEGYLFPDTYLFPPSADASSVIATMRANFNTRISPLLGDIQASGNSLSDVVIVASLVEKEARTTASRRIVAGILWNRLSLGMQLQVDAVFGYIFNRDTYSPSFEDLKVASPYNTYLHTGLPPTPINNPGLDSINSVLHPTTSNYLYYLTGSDNLMHYATTYAGHLANQRKYLR